MKTGTRFWKKISAVLLAMLLFVTAIPFSASAKKAETFAGSDLISISYDKTTSTFRVLFSADIIAGILQNRNITKKDLEDMLPADLIKAYRDGGFVSALFCDAMTDIISMDEIRKLIPDYITNETLTSDAIQKIVDVKDAVAKGYINIESIVAECKEAFGESISFADAAAPADVAALLRDSGIDWRTYISDGGLKDDIDSGTVDTADMAALDEIADKADLLKAVGDAGMYVDLLTYLDVADFLHKVSAETLLKYTDIKGILKIADKTALKEWAESAALLTYASFETLQVNGVELLDCFLISGNAIATVVKNLAPSFTEISDIPADGVLATLSVNAQLTDGVENVGSINIGFEIGVFGSESGITYLENNAARVADNVTCALAENYDFTVTATVPARFTDIVTYILTNNTIPAAAKKKLISAMNGTVGDVVDYLKGLELDTILAYADTLDVRYVNTLVDKVTGLATTYRARVNQLYGYVMAALDQVPASMLDESFSKYYLGEGKFAFDNAGSLRTTDILDRLRTRFGFIDRIYALVADEEISASADVNLTVENLYQIKFYKNNVLFFTAYLPAGADLTVLSDYNTALGGTWYDNNADIVTVMPAEDVNVYDTEPPRFKLFFKIDGELYETVNYTVGDSSVVEPAIPEKYGHTGHWTAYDLSACCDQVVELYYTANTYKLYFTDTKGTLMKIVFFVYGTDYVVEPEISEIVGYDGSWSSYDLNHAINQTVQLTYKLHDYVLTFVDGDQKTYVKFHMGDTSVDEPEFVGKTGCFGKWSKYDLTLLADQTVEASYFPGSYTVSFVADGETVETVSYTFGDVALDHIPDVPVKDGYDGAWDLSQLDLTKAEAQIVNAVYQAKEYTVTFVAEGEIVDTVTYTYGDEKLTDVPAVPSKPGYKGVWGVYDLTKCENQTVEAEYSIDREVYEVIFVYTDGRWKVVEYDKGAESIEIPAVTETAGYTFSWDDFELNRYPTTTVYESKVANTYTITFKADGQVVDTLRYTYNVDSSICFVPAVPYKYGYTGEWGNYSAAVAGDQTVEAKYTAKTFRLIFKLESGEKVVEYPYGATSVTEPALPTKEGYTYVWAEYTLNAQETVNVALLVTKNADDDRTTYKAYFYDGNKLLAMETFTVGGADVSVPTLPVKTGYTAGWSGSVDTSKAQNQVISVVYTANQYKLHFKADGKDISTVTYTYGDFDVTVPAVPEKDGYTGAWGTYDLRKGADQDVEAAYTAKEIYKVNFVFADGTHKTVEYEYGAASVEAPALPEKAGYVCRWEAYSLNVSAEITVNEIQTKLSSDIVWLWVAIPAAVVVGAGILVICIMKRRY